MDLSPQNKDFLDVLHKVGVDVKDFPDKTFDGLFENVPDNLNYFFNWFIENITFENVLTPSERAIYFQLESNQMLPTQEEMDYVFASCTPTYEELQSLDPNYVKILLPSDLEDLRKNSKRLSEISAEIESNYFNLKEKHKSMKEESNSLKKELVTAKQKCDSVNVSFSEKLEEVKEVLLKEPDIKIDFDLYRNCLEMEGSVFDEIKNLEMFKNDLCNHSKLILSETKENFTYVETSLVLSQGFLKAKKKEIEVLSKLLHKKSSQESFNETLMQSQLANDEEITKITNDVKILESKLYEQFNKIGQNKVDEIIHEYFHEKTGVCKSYITQLNKCNGFMMWRNKLDQALLRILKKTIADLENGSYVRKQAYLKLQEYERDFTNSAVNLEMQNTRFKEVSVQQQQHPFLRAVKEVVNIDGNFVKSEETLKNVMELMSYTSGDAGFILQDLKNKVQSSIKHFDNILCGPTSEILFTPVELSIKFQECVACEEKLSHLVKQLASTYMKAKDSISKSNRKILLLWIKFLTQSLVPEKSLGI